MRSDRAQKIRGVVAVLSVTFFSLLVSWALRTAGAQAAGGAAPMTPRTTTLIALGQKFAGSQSCAAAKCHGAAQAANPPQKLANQVTVWSSDDRHSKAFKAL